MPSIYDLKVSGDLASQLQQEQQNGYMMGTDVFNGIQLPNEGDSLYDFLSYLTFGGQSQRAYDIAQMHGIDGPSFTALMNQKNQETAKSAPWLTQQIGNVGNTVAENPALLFAAPLAIAGIGGALAGGSAATGGTTGASSILGTAGGTTGSFINAAGEMVVTGSAGTGGALGSILSNIGSIATGSVLGGTMTGPNPQGPISNTGAPILSQGGIVPPVVPPAAASPPSGDNIPDNYRPSEPPGPVDMTVTPPVVPPIIPPVTPTLPGGGGVNLPDIATTVGAGLAGAAVGNTINQGNQGPPEGDNNTSGLPDWLGPVTNIIGSLLGGQAQANASNNAADAIKQTSADQLSFLRETRDQQLALQQPFLDASKAALPRLAQLAGLEPGVTPQSVMEADPGYQFRLDEGTRALENSAAARGGLLSGGFATNLLKQAQGYASNEYQNVYNRVANIAGFGQVASNAASSAIGQYGNQGAQVIGNSGNASAYNNLQRGNIWANAINDIGSTDWSKFFGNGG